MIANTVCTVEIFSIGTELVMGRIQDTNSHWIARQVAQLGGEVRRITVLPDSKEAIITGFRESLARKTRIIISTGGLGPTPDDLTIECLASLLGVPTHPHEPTLQEYMRRRGLRSRDELTPNLLRMATVPDGVDVLSNPVGWAPCVAVSIAASRIFVLPGPPPEVEAIFSAHISKCISHDAAVKSLSQRVWVDMFESEVSPLLQKVMAQLPNTYLKAYISLRKSTDHQLPIDVVTTGPSAAHAEDTLQQAIRLLGKLVEEKGKTMALEDT